jgi:hypothetical protein
MTMLYITRSRVKESVTGEQLAEINRRIDTEAIPAIKQVEGVRSVQAYNSIAGEVTFVLDIANMATVDRILADAGTRAGMAWVYDLLVRTGGEVLYDRPAWQGLYGRS